MKEINLKMYIDFPLLVNSNITKHEEILHASSMIDSDWELYRERKRAELTAYLHQTCNTEYQLWNELVSSYRTQLIAYLSEEVFFKEAKMNEIIVSELRWDLMHCMMCESYKLYDPPMFFQEIYEVYKLGLFPYGVGKKLNIKTI